MINRVYFHRWPHPHMRKLLEDVLQKKEKCILQKKEKKEKVKEWDTGNYSEQKHH